MSESSHQAVLMVSATGTILNHFFKQFKVITACAVLHKLCLGAADIVAPEDEPEGENGLEAVSDTSWRD